MRILALIILALFCCSSWAQDSIFAGPVLGFIKRSKVTRRVSLERAGSARWESTRATGGYLINQSSDRYYGAGVAYQYSHYEVPALGDRGWANLGVYPVRGSQVVSIRQHEDPRATMLPLPRTSTAWDEWRVGDSLYWKRVKGTGLFLGVGVSLVSIASIGDGLKVGPRLIMTGTFQVYMQKRAADQLYLEVRPGKVRAASVVGSAIVAFVEAGRSFEVERQGIGVLIDPTSARGLEIFDLVLRGRGEEATELLAQAKDPQNRVVAHLEQKRTIGFGKWGFDTLGIPIFSLFKRSESIETTATEMSPEGVVTERQEIAADRTTERSVFGRFENEFQGLRIFMGSEGELRLSWSWEWEHSKGSPKRMARALTRLRGLTSQALSTLFDPSAKNFQRGYVLARLHWESSLRELRENLKGLPKLALLAATVERCVSAQANRDCVRDLGRQVMRLRAPLAEFLSVGVSCVPLQFTVGGEKLKQWAQTLKFCPTRAAR